MGSFYLDSSAAKTTRSEEKDEPEPQKSVVAVKESQLGKWAVSTFSWFTFGVTCDQ